MLGISPLQRDPSKIVSASSGKLIRFLVPSGESVKVDQPVAEVEVSTVVRWLGTADLHIPSSFSACPPLALIGSSPTPDIVLVTSM